MQKLIAVVGTTASGKSDLGVALAQKYHGEIVSADSRQVYRGLDLGSGKIMPEEMGGIVHHLLNVCDPGTFFSMAEFQQQAYAAIDDIAVRGYMPFLVGGTGLYASSVLDGYVLSDTPPDLAYRRELEQYTTPQLYDMLLSVQPDTQVDKNNRNRVMRVMEKLHDGDTATAPRQVRYQTLRLGAAYPRETLRDRIDQRLDKRVRDGMIEEVQGLIDAGVSIDFLNRLGLEYRYVTQYLTGGYATKEEMLGDLSTAIKQFAKRQMTWFRRDAQIHWLDMENAPEAQCCRLIDDFLNDENK